MADQYGNVVLTATDEIDAYLVQASAFTFPLSAYTTNDAIAGVSVFNNLTSNLSSPATPATDVHVYYSTPSGYTPVTNAVITVAPNVGLAFQTEPPSSSTAQGDPVAVAAGVGDQYDQRPARERRQCQPDADWRQRSIERDDAGRHRCQRLGHV